MEIILTLVTIVGGLATILGTSIAVYNNFKKESNKSLNPQEQRFLELVKMISSSNFLEVVNAISILPSFAKGKLNEANITTLKSFYSEVNRSNPYLKEVVSLITTLLVSNKISKFDAEEKKKINQACGEAISKISHQTLKNVHGKPISFIDIKNNILDGISIPYVFLKGANLFNAKLNKSNLYKADFSHSNLSESKFTEANLNLAKFLNTNLDKADFKKAFFNKYGDVGATKFEKTSMIETNFEKAIMDDVEFVTCNAKDANFEKAKLWFAEFDNCDLESSTFGEADVRDVRFSHCNLETIHLIEADLSGARFIKCNMFCASLKRANLAYAKFVNCDLKSVDFNGAIYNKYLYEQYDDINQIFRFEPLTDEQFEKFAKCFPEMADREDDFGYLWDR